MNINVHQEIIQTGALMYQKGLLVATDGNLSRRVDESTIAITASGVCKGMLTQDDISLVDLEGNLLEGKAPARDIRMHLAVYKTDCTAVAVIHAHPPFATGFAISRYNFDAITLPEVLFAVGGVAMTEYAAPTTNNVPKVLVKSMLAHKDYKAFILANHGAVTIGTDMMDAFFKMESLELYLKATLIARMLGKEVALNETQVNELYTLI